MTEVQSLTIPADGLADARAALTGALSEQGSRLDRGVEFEREIDDDDRRAGVRAMAADVQLLEQLLDASGDTTVSGEPAQLYRLVEGIARRLLRRLGERGNSWPMDLDEVGALAARLEWASAEGARLALAANPGDSRDSRTPRDSGPDGRRRRRILDSDDIDDIFE
jgi:hypothetical protein